MEQSTGIAVDASGNVWVANSFYYEGAYESGGDIVEFSNAGIATSGNQGYCFSTAGNCGGVAQPNAIAIDASGYAWTANFYNSSVSKVSSTGNPSSPSAGYTGGGLNQPQGIAIDGSGNVWASNAGSNSVSKLTSTGAAISPSSGYKGGGFGSPYGIAIDGSGNVWVANSYSGSTGGYNSVTELVGAATPVVTPIVANLISPYSAPASKP